MKYTVLPAVLYRYKTWSLKLTVRTQADCVQKQGAEKDIWEREAVTSDWRKTHNEELHDAYSSPNIVWVMKSGCVAQKGERTGAYRVLVREI
jgi:hypothetical protein